MDKKSQGMRDKGKSKRKMAFLKPEGYFKWT